MYALLDNTKKRRESLRRQGYDCTPIHVQYFPGFVDFWGFGISLMLLPIAVSLWCLVTVVVAPVVLIGKIYCIMNKRPLDRYEGPGFDLFLKIVSPFAGIVMAIAYVWFAFVYVFSLMMASPVALLRILFGQYHVLENNFKILKPYWRQGAFSYADSVRAILGQADRHGFLNFWIGSPLLGSFASSVCHVPILKYCWSTNPLLYELEVVHINQWTPGLDTLTLKQVKHRTQTKVGRAKHLQREKKHLESSRFTPHYPYGESLGVEDHLQLTESDEGVVGSQYLNCHPKLFGYTRSVYCKDTDKMDSENGALPIFRVYLDFFGYHFLTGYVELNVAKNGGVEHPMWIIVPKHGKLGRDLYEFANILFVPYLKEAIYSTLVLRDDDERDRRMSGIALVKRNSMNQIVASANPEFKDPENPPEKKKSEPVVEKPAAEQPAPQSTAATETKKDAEQAAPAPSPEPAVATQTEQPAPESASTPAAEQPAPEAAPAPAAEQQPTEAAAAPAE